MERKLRIFYTTDVHGFFSPVDYATGAPAATGTACCFSAFEKDGNTLVIDGGDTLQGSPFTYYLHKTANGDNLPAKVMNLGGYDFFTLGNHDFNYGPAALQAYLDGMNARCLCANVTGPRGIEKTAVVTLQNGLRVGLTGVVTHWVNIWEKPYNLTGITITEPLPAAAAALAELKAQGVDLTICIYHGGFEADLTTGAPLTDTDENQGYRLASELGFDILLSGHQHLPIADRCVCGTYTCQTPDKARSYARMDVSVTESGVTATSVLCPAPAEPLPAAMELLAPYEAACSAWLDKPVGFLDAPLLPREHLDMALHGCAIANFFNAVQLEVSGAELSCTSLANEVKGFSTAVSVRDVVATYVYPNTLVTLEVTAAALRAAVERSAAYFTLNEDGTVRVSDAFLKPKVEHYNYDYFAGLDIVLDLRKPVGERAVSILYRGAPLSDNRTYTLCMNNYRASGTGGYECFKPCRRVREQPTEISEFIMDYISSHGQITVDRAPHLQVLY